jgi:tetratricopeptide (TPR) repeat protein
MNAYDPNTGPSDMLYRISTLLFMAFVFLYAFTPISDVDSLIHLSIGRLIWDLKGIPDTEMFVYPNAGKDFQYTSSLFALISYIMFKVLNNYGPVILKAGAAAAAFYIMLKDSLRPYNNIIAALIILLLSVTVVSHRFVLRPEILVMVYLAFSIFCLNAYLYDNKRYIYALPVVFLLWGNTHLSINLMFVLFAAFIVGGLMQRQLNNRGITDHPAPSGQQIKQSAIVFAISIVAALINPNFIWQFIYGANVLSSNWSSLVIELLPPVGIQKTILIGIISTITLSFALNWRRLSVYHLMLVLPFIYLPFTAYRFTFISVIVGGPIAARNFSSFIRHSNLGKIENRKTLAAISISITLLYAGLALSGISPIGNKSRETGVGIANNKSLNRLIDFMDANDIKGRVLNPFHLGQYIIWKSYPERTVFIDGRLEFFSEKLIMAVNDFVQDNTILDKLHLDYGFESIVMEHPNPVFMKSESGSHAESGGAMVRYAYIQHPDWALVYWDDEYMLYVRRNKKNQPVINQYEYRHAFPDREISMLYNSLLSTKNRRFMYRELLRNVQSTGSSIGYAMLGVLLFEDGKYREALDALSHVNYKGDYHVKTANIYNLNLLSLVHSGDSYLKLGKPGKGLEYYLKFLAIREDPDILYKAGKIFAEQGLHKEAAEHLGKALELDPEITDAYQHLIIALEKIGNKAEADRIRGEYAKLTPESQIHFEKGISLYSQKKYEEAIAEFVKALETEPSNSNILTYLGYVYYDTGQMDYGELSFMRAIDASPDNANAHYGLGLIGVKSANKKLVQKHFSIFLKLVPEGKFADRARALMDE